MTAVPPLLLACVEVWGFLLSSGSLGSRGSFEPSFIQSDGVVKTRRIGSMNSGKDTSSELKRIQETSECTTLIASLSKCCFHGGWYRTKWYQSCSRPFSLRPPFAMPSPFPLKRTKAARQLQLLATLLYCFAGGLFQWLESDALLKFRFMALRQDKWLYSGRVQSSGIQEYGIRDKGRFQLFVCRGYSGLLARRWATAKTPKLVNMQINSVFICFMATRIDNRLARRSPLAVANPQTYSVSHPRPLTH